MVWEDLRLSKILTKQAFENAIRVNAAIGGSTNAVIHLKAIAGRMGVPLELEDWTRIGRGVPTLVDLMPSGRWLMEEFYYAGGLPAVLRRLGEHDLLPHKDALTVNGKTLWENVKDAPSYNDEVIRTLENALIADGGIRVLRGNLAPRGAVVKYFSVPDEMHVHVGPARVFDFEDSAVEALLARRVLPGDVVVIRYEGPRANGMPEMYFATTIIAADPTLMASTAIVTDGRFSGAAKGPAVGHVTPEALDGGPIALVEEGDLLEIHIPERRLAIVGVAGQRLAADEIERVLAERRGRWSAPPPRHTSGILSLYSRIAGGSDVGAALT
jgi:dihydroxyacid dehydratase/phosphogluconate dehydratase